MKTSILFVIGLFTLHLGMAQTTVTISPTKDNTLYESVAGDISNGAGEYLFLGRTNQGDLRRAVVYFDISSELSSVDSVTDISLNFQVSKVPNSTSRTVNIHRLSQDWGEGTSDASGQEGTGTTATSGDATWTEAFFGGTNPTPWNNVGGDFDATASGSVDVGGLGAYSATSSQMVADVQDWLDNPSNNFGWILIGNETTNASAKRFNSRENTSNPISVDVTFISSVSSINNYQDGKNVSIYPNPVESNFELNNSINLNKIEILDLNGQSRKILNPQSKVFDISDLDRGIYLLKLQLGDESITKKLIKQ